MAICKTCRGIGEYKSGLHLIACPNCNGDGEVTGQGCYTCGVELPAQTFTYRGFARPDVIHHFCSQKCVDNYEANGYMEAEGDYYSGEWEVDSDPYDYDSPCY